MRSCNSYQDIETPEDLEEEMTEETRFEMELQEMLEEYDADMNCPYRTYKMNCINAIRRRHANGK